MRKRVWSVILTLCLLMGMAPPWARAAVVDSGTCGDNVTWTLDDAGTLTISGSGPMADYSYHDNSYAPWYSSSEDSGVITVVIENGITSIGDEAFFMCMRLTSVTIPNSVTSIGYSAFEECGVTNVIIPNGVTFIGDSAFHNCSELRSVTIPNSVTTIEEWAFNGCSSLMSITIPDSITSISDYAFGDCHSLMSVTIPNSVTSIGDGAFNYCESLTSVTIPNSVTSIVEAAFHHCTGLTSVMIPSSVTSIGEGAFGFCDSLTNVNVESNNPKYASENGVLLDKDNSILVCYPAGKSETAYTISDSVTSIGGSAFAGCDNLTSVTIPNSVTSIGSSAFQTCSGLTNITIPNSVTSVGRLAFAFCSGLTSVYYGGTQAQWRAITIGTDNEPLTNAAIYCTDGVLNGNTNTNEQPDLITDNSNAESIVPDNGRTSYAVTFNRNGGAGSMNPVSVSGSVYTLPENGFTAPSGMRFRVWRVQDKSGNRYEYFPGTTIPVSSDLTVTALWENDTNALAQGYCGAESGGQNLTWTLSRDWNLTVSGAGDMASYDADNRAPWYGYHTNIQTATLESGVTRVGSNAFTYCSALEEVTLPDTLIIIEDGAFLNCAALESVNLPSGLLTLGNSAFYGCESLESVSIPASVRDTGDYTFEHCAALSSVSFAAGLARVGYYAFHDCGLESVTLPEGLRTIDTGAFSECADLRNFIFPESLESIRDHVFSGCARFAQPSRNARYNGTVAQFSAIAQTLGIDNDPLKAQVVHCIDGDYDWTPPDPYLILDPLQNTAEFVDQILRSAGPLVEFQRLLIDDTPLMRASALTRTGLDYTAEEGSTLLTIPAETFQHFKEGTHNFELEFFNQTEGIISRRGRYTVYPDKAEIDTRDIAGVTGVEKVAYGGVFRAKPEFEPGMFRFHVVSGQLPPGLALQDGGYFTGVPQAAGTYSFTVGLQISRFGQGFSSDEDTASVTILIEPATEIKVETASDPGYAIVMPIPDQVVETVMDPDEFELVSQGPFEEFHELYVDGELIPRSDYTVRPYDLDENGLPRTLDAGGVTGTYIASKNIRLSEGVHPVNLTFQHKDSLGNTEIKKSAQTVKVTKTNKAPAPVASGGGGGGGGRTSSGPATTYYTISKATTVNGTIKLSASSAKAGSQVVIAATPAAGYSVGAVTVIASNKQSVPVTGGGGSYSFTMPTRRVTVSATFTRPTHSATVAESPHGAVSLSAADAAPGDTVTVSTTPDNGYLLSGVTVRGPNGVLPVAAIGNGSYTFSMPSGNVTASANFTPKRLGTFVDVLGPYWFFEAAEWAYNRGILRGQTEQYWEPESKISDVTSIVTLERLDGVDLTPYDTGANDGLDNSKWYVSAARWAKANGICDPYRAFNENKPLTRGEYALMLCNFLRYRGLNLNASASIYYSDAAALTPDQMQAFQFLQYAGVFKGFEDGTIRPSGELNRAQMAVLLHRLSQYIIRTETRAF